MSVYPHALDTDAEIPRVEDGVSETSGEITNAIREAIFALEAELGINPSGSLSSVSDRLAVSLNENGTIKAAALASAGLVTLPITDTHIATGAGIKEYKLDLDYSTSNLNTAIVANSALITSLVDFSNEINSDLSTHIAGGNLLSDNSPARHVASHIDLNADPTDSRDVSYNWSGLLDKDGNKRSATQVADALLQINNELTSHQNAVTGAHVGTAITLDTSNFTVVPLTVNTVQKLADYVDDSETLQLGTHRATQHANGIPQIARSQGLSLPDGYGWANVVPVTSAITYLVTSPNIKPVDDTTIGDDIIKFVPDNSSFNFDAQFSQVKPGDIIRVDYGSGFEATHIIDSIRFTPGSEWIVRINGTNILDTTDGYASARIDRPTYDRDTAGVLAVAAANATPTGSFDSILQSVIVGSPRGAVALGLGFDPGQLDSTHYNLYLELYPNGNPADKTLTLPAIDVTGNAGVTPGKYTLESVVASINNKFRQTGYNYRFIAFAYQGEVGIMLADAINNASFAIISGDNSSGTLQIGTFSNNVIGDAAGDDFDTLGFGQNHADLASPTFQSSFVDSTAAQLPTKVIVPRKRRHYIANGFQRDSFADTWNANSDGHWDGYIFARNQTGSTVETTYVVELDLKPAGLKPGKTLVIQPAVTFSDSLYNDVDYGRFIIKSVDFIPVCDGDAGKCQITVINSIHGFGSAVTSSGVPDLPVKIYFGEDSVGFDSQNVIDTGSAPDYHRLHEVFITGEGKTFSHERARLKVQSGAGSLLDTANWHITNVSPKLRGYKDGDGSFNKYVRFYILSYDSLTGEFDGYLGQRNPNNANISKVGPVVTGRKNIPTKFYDESYLDYVELVFDESASTLVSATDILPGTARYVDIELFDSLIPDDELLLLATVEVNWDPQSGQNVIQKVRDRREFGSIDAEDFTESAKDFISAGDRLLHENGVIKGLSFDFINPTDNREIYFKGGLALVNGAITTTNAQSVTIPEIREDGYAVPTTVDWAICVDQYSNLVPIIITSTKRQFFAISGSTTYYVPSVTFNELVNTRKDLTPIYVVTANIASITINDSDVKDIRRFVNSSGLMNFLTLSGEDFVGNFSSFDAATNWVNNYGSSGTNKIIVRGEFNLSSSVDLTSLTNPVAFEGDGAVINVTANRGFLVNNQITFNNITFTYNPAATGTANNYVNTGNGCIYHAAGSDSNNVKVIDCRFSSAASGKRPPFINFELNKNDLVRNLDISKCKFTDTGNDGYEAAIAIVSLNGGASSDPALFSNASISQNICEQKQGVYVTSTDSGGSLTTPGLSANHVVIDRNSCGTIGYLISSKNNSNYTTGYNRKHGLIISDNSAHFIGTMGSDGLAIHTRANTDAEFPYGLGSVLIEDNFANWIHVVTGDESTEKSSAIIKNNTLQAYDFTYHNVVHGNSLIGSGYAILAQSYKSDDANSCIITGNSVDGYSNGTSATYTYGIYSSVSSHITNNSISGFTNSGIFLTSPSLSYTRNQVATHNIISREDRTISAYVRGTADVLNHVLLTDNIFDSHTIDIDGTSTSTILTSGRNWIVERNKNQTETININNFGDLAINGVALNTTETSSISEGSFSSDSISDAYSFEYKAVDGSVNFSLRTSLFNSLPPNVTIIGAEVTLVSSLASAGTVFLRMSRDGASTNAQDSTAVTTTGVTLNIVDDTTNFSTATFKNTAANNLHMEVAGTISNASNLSIDISSVLITYRW